MEADHGSGTGHGAKGSKIKAVTKAAMRARTTPEFSRSYSYGKTGAVILPESRRNEGLASKNERSKLAKELNMARTFAKAGHRIEFTGHGAGNHDVFIDGKRADLKQVSSHNNIVKYGKHAIKDQGASVVLFEITRRSDKITQTIRELSRKGIHGKYYYSDDKKIHTF